MYHYLITIQYDGTSHHGWQRLTNQTDTIQGILENALSLHFSEPVRITGSGRTDAGVHALCQCADFFCCKDIKNQESDFISALNTILPADIRITSIRNVPDDFHSRKSCIGKTYTYYVMLTNKPNVFARNYAYCPADTPFQLKNDLQRCDFSAMQTAADILIGTHDFSSFTTDKNPNKSHIRCIDSIIIDTAILPFDIPLLSFQFSGNGFLYNMVRILSGTLLAVGLGEISADDIPYILNAKKRSYAGPTLPPCGLFLTDVKYPFQ